MILNEIKEEDIKEGQRVIGVWFHDGEYWSGSFKKHSQDVLYFAEEADEFVLAFLDASITYFEVDTK